MTKSSKLNFHQLIIDGVIQHIRANAWDRTLNVKKTALHSGYSLGYLQILFKKITGRCLHEFIKSNHMEHIKHVLLISSDSIYEIARAHHYHSTREFNRRFKRHFGISPSEYRMRREIICPKAHSSEESA
ncbi:helix-turn-helix transcriptional regulator [Enterobacter mori]|uniref:helix-turn-helix transcriptional regulator n=1 Tax=Enterobacter mori TaxID=539813 RepID=UPI00398B6F4D